ncbi:MAG: helix-turn-helix transcriptional regulator [Solirubrobacteraceae bacterium]|jgi:predicted transcriptional regulator
MQAQQAHKQTASSVRERRIAAGMTQRELAIAADCSLPSVANLEAGVLPRRSEVVPRILDALAAAEREAL